MAVRTHKFNGVTYDIDIYEPHMASCENPKNRNRNPQITLAIDYRTKDGLIVLLHEACHATSWLKSEELVGQFSKDAGEFLWRIGFRALPKEILKKYDKIIKD